MAMAMAMLHHVAPCFALLAALLAALLGSRAMKAEPKSAKAWSLELRSFQAEAAGLETSAEAELAEAEASKKSRPRRDARRTLGPEGVGGAKEPPTTSASAHICLYSTALVFGWVEIRSRTNCLPGCAWAIRCSPAVHPRPIVRS